MSNSPINDPEIQVFNSVRDSLKIIILRSTDRCVTYLNPEGISSFGIESPEEILQIKRRQLFADPEMFQCINMKLGTYGRIQNERILFKRADQSNFWGLLTSIERIIDDESFYEEVIIDISKEVDQEHKLIEKTHLLDKVSSELDRFIYSASHDLRSPISTMMGLVSLMKAETNLEHNNYLGFLEGSLQKLDAHVRKLTTFSKITNESLVVLPIDLKEVITNIFNELKDHTNYQKVITEVVFATRSTVDSDFSNVRTILFQLLKNAFDFSDLKKPTSFLFIKVIDVEKKMRIEIIDNGIGIEKIHQDNVFKLFYRGTASSKGNGLGLYLVKEALVKIQGTIELKTEPRVGTSIAITIPDLNH